MWTVYILKSSKINRYYIGCTNDIERRILEHNRGYEKFTKSGVPWKVVYSELVDNQTLAYQREKAIKSYKGGNAFKKLINQ